MDIERIVVRRVTRWDENYKYAVSKEEDVRTEIPYDSERARNGLRLAEMGDLKQDWKDEELCVWKWLEPVGEINAYRRCVLVEGNKVWGEPKERDGGEEARWPQHQRAAIWRHSLWTMTHKVGINWCWDQSQRISILIPCVTQSLNSSPLTEFKGETTTR